MKKTNNKLNLNTTTIRVLQGGELAQARGGAPTVGAGCTSHSDQPNCQHTKTCPPQHSEHCPASHEGCGG